MRLVLVDDFAYATVRIGVNGLAFRAVNESRLVFNAHHQRVVTVQVPGIGPERVGLVLKKIIRTLKVTISK